MTTLSVLCSPPRSGVFIAVVAGCRRTPLSSLSEVLPLPAAKADQVSSCQLVRVVGYLELGPLPISSSRWLCPVDDL